MMSDPLCVKCPYSDCHFTADKSEYVRAHMKYVHHDEEKLQSRYGYYVCGNCMKKFNRRMFFTHMRESEYIEPVHRYKRRCPAVDKPASDAVCSDDGPVDPVSIEDRPVDNPNPVINGDLPIDTPIDPLHVATREYSTQVTDIIDKNYLEFATTNHLSLAVVMKAIQITEKLNAVTVKHTENLIHRLLTVHLSDNPEKVQQIMKDLPYSLRPLSEPLKCINTKYRLETYFTSLPTFVKPVFISFMKSKNTVIIPPSFRHFVCLSCIVIF
jgi:hypothetical protein